MGRVKDWSASGGFVSLCGWQGQSTSEHSSKADDSSRHSGGCVDGSRDGRSAADQDNSHLNLDLEKRPLGDVGAPSLPMPTEVERLLSLLRDRPEVASVQIMLWSDISKMAQGHKE